MQRGDYRIRNSQSQDEAYDLWLLIAQARHAMLRARQEELGQNDLTVRHVATFHALNVVGDGANLTDLSRLLFLKPHSTSELLTRMEKKGLLKRAKDPRGKNRVMIKLTEKGHKASRLSSKRESIHMIMSCLSSVERKQLQSCLVKLRSRALQILGGQEAVPYLVSPFPRVPKKQSRKSGKNVG